MKESEALHASEHDLRLIIESIPGFVWTDSAVGEIELVNQPYLNYLGKTVASKSYPPNTVLIISFDEIKLFGHYSWNQMLSRVATEGGLSGSAFRSISLFNIATNELQTA